jgi:hypothetical protein
MTDAYEQEMGAREEFLGQHVDEALGLGKYDDTDEMPVLWFEQTQWQRTLLDLSKVKAEDFHLIGYPNVEAQEILDCVFYRYKRTGVPAMHRVVDDIFSLSAPDLMNHMMLNAFKGIGY